MLLTNLRYKLITQLHLLPPPEIPVLALNAVKVHQVPNVTANPIPILPPEVVVASTPPQYSCLSSDADDTDVKWFSHPGTFWCPWNSKSCTNALNIRGEGVVEIMQQTSIPFEIHLSNKKDANDPTAYSIILSIDEKEVILRTSFGTSDSSTELHHTLQPDDGSWHRYWISFSKITLQALYGIGEIRPFFTILNSSLKESDLQQIKEIQYLHIKLNKNDRMLTDLGHIQDKVRFYIGNDPVIHELPLIIIPKEQYTLEHEVNHSAMLVENLQRPCRELYHSVYNFKLNTDDFPDFVDVIEKSIRNPAGWCHRKLVEKANRFGKPNLMVTYLRITAGKREGRAPGHSYVTEIWPPGHGSPIHNHGNVYSIVRVLHGRIFVKLYPQLTLNTNLYKPIETMFEEGQVTWMLPKLNQTHQLQNIDVHDKSAITIQCYKYGREDREHYEYFDYIANDGKSIGHFDPKSDMDYDEFKALMRQERQNLY
ncbi:unnamed protein product [Rotaria sp. Silwood1]|nr:unnamed protein product [Rotaria sp. Silwood1]CAF3526362.1 unnamed protein product [Rotaria sp. Silwood1]CAF3600165.1 unnamed protein product [Rotaria sp. Silwood1]CAF4756555.1 unnamed protein product [Rotaria sp. Silwood1]CAF4762548.1 unnamed protein product [Rotaria sp. Silwood1]